MLDNKDLCISKRKKDFVKFFFQIQTQFYSWFVFKYNNFFYCGLKFMLLEESVLNIGINNIMFNYLCHNKLATEYEELKNTQPLWAQFI